MSTPRKSKANLNRSLNRVPLSPMRQVVNEAANARKVFVKYLNNAFKFINLNARSPYSSPAKKSKH
jgi:hypothetical protein